MRIHTNLLDLSHVKAACKVAGVGIERLTEHGSRSHERAFDLILSGAGKHGGQYGVTPYKSATWDQWGIVLGHLYADDYAIKAGPYEDGHHFDYATGYRFDYRGDDGLSLADAHVQHRWKYEYAYEFSCKCGATLLNR